MMEKRAVHKISRLSVAEETKFLPLPPDGGYGWVIVVVSFICNGVVDGICSTFGVFLPHFLEEFGESKAKTALCGSLMAGCYLATGPMASALINCFGCRAVTMAGGLLATTALVFSRFASNVDTLIVLYGVLGGVGMGFMYVPSMVMVGYYFERRRAVASGISSSGSGAGMLVLVPLAVSLLSNFDWRNSNLLMACCTLQCVVLGALMRPLEASKRRKLREERLTDVGIGDTRNKDTTSLKGAEEEDTMRLDKCCPSVDKVSTTGHLNLKGKTCESFESRLDCENEGASDETTDDDSGVKLDSDHDSGVKLESEDSTPQLEDLPSAPGTPKQTEKKVHRVQWGSKSCQNLHLGHYSHTGKGKSVIPIHSLGKEIEQHIASLSVSCHEIAQHKREMLNTQTEKKPGVLLRDMSELLLKPMVRRDIFYNGSVQMLPEFRSQPSLESYRASVTMIPDTTRSDASSRVCPCLPPSSVDTLKEMLDLSLLKNAYFLIISVASVFIQLAYFVPMFFISEYAMFNGIDQQRAALLISIIGISNVVGRVVAGVVGSVPWINTLHFHNIVTISCGVACLLVPLCTTYPLLVVYAVWFGLSAAAFVPLTTVFLVEYLGLHCLTNAFGLLSMVRGFSSMAGSPLAGVLWEASNSYGAMFYMAGGCLIVAGLLYYLLPCAKKLKKRGEDSTDSSYAADYKVSDPGIDDSENEEGYDVINHSVSIHGLPILLPTREHHVSVVGSPETDDTRRHLLTNINLLGTNDGQDHNVSMTGPSKTGHTRGHHLSSAHMVDV